MSSFIYFVHTSGRHVSLDLCGGQTGMAEQHLHHAKVCAAGKEVAGKGVAENMGRYAAR